MTMTSYERHGVSNHWQTYCLFNGLFRLTTKEYQSSAFLALGEGNPSVTGGFHFKRDSSAESVSTWRHHHASLWRHNGHDSVSNHQLHDCLLSRLFRRRSKKISKLRVTGLCVGNSPETGEFPAQMASNAENVSIWWRHHGLTYLHLVLHRCIGEQGDHCFRQLLFAYSSPSHYLKLWWLVINHTPWNRILWNK